MSIRVRALEFHDFADWLPLWDLNNLGERNEEVTAETWRRLNDSSSQVNGLGAFEHNVLVGFLHYIEHPTTGYIEPVCYMQDVFVNPTHRQKGIAKKLVTELARIGKQDKKWARIHWFAENNNQAAQSLYKNIGVKLDFALHVLFPND